MEIFKALIWNNLVNLALARLVGAMPFLAWGPVNAFVRWLAFKVSDAIFEELHLRVDLHQIVVKNEKLKKEYDRASIKLGLISRTEGRDSDEFKKAESEFKNSLADLVRYSTP